MTISSLVTVACASPTMPISPAKSALRIAHLGMETLDVESTARHAACNHDVTRRTRKRRAAPLAHALLFIRAVMLRTTARGDMRFACMRTLFKKPWIASTRPFFIAPHAWRATSSDVATLPF